MALPISSRPIARPAEICDTWRHVASYQNDLPLIGQGFTMSQAGSNGASAAAISGQPYTLLATLQLADSFFPTGMFTQSHGLESFVAAGVTSAAQLEPLLHSYLLHIAASGDAL